MEWYYAINDEQFGPVSAGELAKLIASGHVRADDLVWNASFEDGWVVAADVAEFRNLFAGAGDVPESGAASRKGFVSRTLRRGREALRGRWMTAIAACFLAGVAPSLIVLFFVSLFYLFQSKLDVIVALYAVFLLTMLVASAYIAYGLIVFLLKFVRGQRAGVSEVLPQGGQIWTVLGAGILQAVYTYLWTLLFVVPGIIAMFSYSMTLFVIADNPGIGANEAIARSKAMMRGYKWKLFCMFLVFYLWGILCVLTLGIGYIWLVPYMCVCMAQFYEDLPKRDTRRE